jgi:lipopolysaccharide transport system ATP-binding protein
MSDDVIIRAENIGKRYTLNHHGSSGGYRKFSDTLIQAAKAPLHWCQPATSTPQSSQEDFWALKDINFEIKQGDVVGIIGRNGAGKSTLLKILSRITEPTQGRITLNGRVASLLEVGTGFHPELTGRENIYLNGAILGMKKGEIKAKFDEIVAFAEVERFLDTPVKRYSSGMYVRLAFAVAAHLEPEILIVDEVLAVGDAQFQKKCLGKMQDVSVTGRTVIFVSHNISIVQELCNQLIFLKQGSIHTNGNPSNVIRTYLFSENVQTPEISLTHSKRTSAAYNSCHLDRVVAKGSQASRGFFYPYGEKIRFSVIIILDKEVQAFELGIACLTRTRFEIASSLSRGQLPFRNLQKGIYEIQVSYEDLKLTPGVYLFDLGIKSNRGIEDRIVDAFEIEILPEEAAVAEQTHKCSGVLIPTVKYEISHYND